MSHSGLLSLDPDRQWPRPRARDPEVRREVGECQRMLSALQDRLQRFEAAWLEDSPDVPSSQEAAREFLALARELATTGHRLASSVSTPSR